MKDTFRSISGVEYNLTETVGAHNSNGFMDTVFKCVDAGRGDMAGYVARCDLDKFGEPGAKMFGPVCNEPRIARLRAWRVVVALKENYTKQK